MSTYFFNFVNVLLNGAVKARGVGVSERKEEPLISLARPNPLAFDRAQISSTTLTPKSRLSPLRIHEE